MLAHVSLGPALVLVLDSHAMRRLQGLGLAWNDDVARIRKRRRQRAKWRRQQQELRRRKRRQLLDSMRRAGTRAKVLGKLGAISEGKEDDVTA